MIIALGEAFIAIGIGASGIGIGLGEVVASILGVLVAASLWLAYFDCSPSAASGCSAMSRAPIASPWRATCTPTRTSP